MMTDEAHVLGLRLKTERERRGMSLQKAADQLRLEAWVIEALEAGDYPRIGPSVYVKGHLKKYSRILGVNPEERAADAPAKPNGAAAIAVGNVANVRLMGSPLPPKSTPWPEIAAGVVVVGIVGVMLWWRPWQQPHRFATSPVAAAAGAAGAEAGPQNPQEQAAQPPGAPARNAPASGVSPFSETSAAKAPTGAAAASAALSQSDIDRLAESYGSDSPLPLPASATAQEAAVAVAAPSPMIHTALTKSAPLPAPSVAPPAPPASAATSIPYNLPGGGRARLRLSFSADSWVDVRDALGKPVFAGKGRANSVKMLGGQAPLKIYLGSAGGVQLEINSRAVAIGSQFFSGDAARFEAGADGVLRRDPAPALNNGVQARTAAPRD